MIRQFCIWALTLAFAIIAGWQAFGQVAREPQPLLAIHAWPTNGHALASAADALFKTAVRDNGNLIPKSMSPQAGDLARHGFALEPLSAEAVRMTALDLDMSGDRARARKVMRLVTALSKRDRIANFWLVEDYGRLQNLPAILEKYDWTLRTSRSVQEVLFPVMVQSLTDPIFIAPYHDLLRSNPPWAPDFWQRLVRSKGSLVNAARLRARLGSGAGASLGEQDAELSNQLVKNGHLTEAFSLRQSLLGNEANGKTMELIANADFAKQPFLPPFDWELLSDGEYGAAIDSEQGQLIVSAVPDASGVAARQLVKAPPGNYRLQVQLAQNKLESTELRVDVRCAQAPRATNRVASLPITGKNNTLDLTLGGGGCGFFWIEWVVTIPGGAPFDDVVVDAIRLLPSG